MLVVSAWSLARGGHDGDGAPDKHAQGDRLLKQVAKAYPRVELHIVCDNYGTHKHPKIKTWLERNPRITLHYENRFLRRLWP